MNMDVTDKQRDILRHALGFGRRTRPGWRNHFVTGPGSDDYDDCEALVAAGLMTKRSGGPLSGGDPVYRVTDAGEALLIGRKTPNVAGNRLARQGQSELTGVLGVFGRSERTNEC